MKKFQSIIGKKARGFTIVETLLSSIVSIIVIAFVTSFFLNIIISKQEYLLREEVNYSTKFALEQIIRHLKQTTSVDTLNSTLEIHPGSITIQTADPNTSPLIIESTGTDLQITRGLDEPTSLITSEVEVVSLIFDFATPNNSPGTISGQLTLRSIIEPTIERTEAFSISLRTNL